MSDTPTAAIGWQPVRYCIETDTMAVEIRPWPGPEDDDGITRDAGVDLVIHYAPDGQPCLCEIEHASHHPEHIAAALAHAPAGRRRSLMFIRLGVSNLIVGRARLASSERIHSDPNDATIDMVASRTWL